jgi:tetratricopeptide (TPR) repeat protein
MTSPKFKTILIAGFLSGTSGISAAQTTTAHVKKLINQDYPIAAAMLSADMIKQSRNPIAPELAEAWKTLHRLTTNSTVLSVIRDLSSKIKTSDANPPHFGNDWHYYRAIALSQTGKTKEAIEEMEKVQLKDRFFSHALYLKAMYLLELQQNDDAIVNLKAILMPETRKFSALDSSGEKRILSYTHLALARIYYQQRQFDDSIRHFRKIEKGVPGYYNALFEQSWALFLAGYPQHALGALHGVRSPFFDRLYNPEAPLLQAIIHYWLCGYDHAKFSLATFSQEYKFYADSLNNYTQRLRFTPEQAFQLFEDFVSGVTSEALGVDRRLLETASSRETMLLLRDQLASTMSEQKRLRMDRSIGTDLQNLASAQLETLSKDLKQMIGQVFIANLKTQGENFQKLGDQADFLQVEMLFSEKDQLLGKNVQASLKIQKAKDDDLQQWATREQTWGVDRKKEFWWDEIGYQLIPVQDQCQ